MSWPVKNCKRHWSVLYDFASRKVTAHCMAIVIDSTGKEVERVEGEGIAWGMAEKLAQKHGIPSGSILRSKTLLTAECPNKKGVAYDFFTMPSDGFHITSNSTSSSFQWFAANESFILEEEIEF